MRTSIAACRWLSCRPVCLGRDKLVRAVAFVALVRLLEPAICSRSLWSLLGVFLELSGLFLRQFRGQRSGPVRGTSSAPCSTAEGFVDRVAEFRAGCSASSRALAVLSYTGIQLGRLFAADLFQKRIAHRALARASIARPAGPARWNRFSLFLSPRLEAGRARAGPRPRMPRIIADQSEDRRDLGSLDRRTGISLSQVD